jgi:epoxyqueuosine reductase
VYSQPIPLEGTTIESRIKLMSVELGFAACGITSALPPPHHREYKQWLASGSAGEMLYLHRQEPKRGKLEDVLPGVKSVVAVAMNYWSGDSGENESKGRIARYARFDDYHNTIWERLDQLLAFVQSAAPGTQGKRYCDTGPITERDLAMRAGLGWIGKHTNLINRKLGNWFFLGELLLTVDLQTDKPEEIHCGTCQRCIPACPTGAITAPYKLDARRCISYLTIELKGSIPIELRPLIGNRIYGCDDCLAICPWNRFAVNSSDSAVKPRTDLQAPELVELLELDDKSFATKFANSPILRTKRRGLVRNVCVALGNSRDISVLPHLERATKDKEPLVQEHAAWAINQIETQKESNPDYAH